MPPNSKHLNSELN